jgi:hypothetical protein
MAFSGTLGAPTGKSLADFGAQASTPFTTSLYSGRGSDFGGYGMGGPGALTNVNRINYAGPRAGASSFFGPSLGAHSSDARAAQPVAIGSPVDVAGRPFRAGAPGLVSGSGVPMIMADGTPWTVPQELVQLMLARGARYA